MNRRDGAPPLERERANPLFFSSAISSALRPMVSPAPTVAYAASILSTPGLFFGICAKLRASSRVLKLGLL